MADTLPVDPYPVIEFSSIDELARLIQEATAGWDTKWYRGTKSPNYSLLPKLFRDPELQKREGYLAVEFRRRARSIMNGMTSPFEYLCAMQHFGIPTRLLDWTESLSVALYFSVRPIDVDLDLPTIWVLNPHMLYALNDKSANVIPIATSPDVVANADIAFNELSLTEESHRTSGPLPVAPDFLFTRLAMQNGAFTIHGTDTAPLEAAIPTDKRDLLRKFVAGKSHVSRIWNSLDLIIPSSDALFPDLEGLKDYIV